MLRSTKRLFIISAVAVLFFSCGSSPVKNAVPVADFPPVFPSTYFSSEADYVYKANITVYGKSLSGILVAKKTGAGHRVVFTTEFGNKLIDLAVSPDSFTVNYIIPDLDRKILVNTLRSDFQLMFTAQFPISGAYSVGGQTVYTSHANRQTTYLFLDGTSRKLEKLTRWNRRKQQISIAFTPQNDIFARNIIIRHSDIKLTMEFNLLNQTN